MKQQNPDSPPASSPVMFLREILAPFFVGAALFANSCLAQVPVETNAPAANATVLKAAGETNKTEVVNVAQLLASARESAKNVPSLLLSQQEKIESVETFVRIAGIRSSSGQEGAIRDELARMLGSLSAKEILCTPAGTNVPLNLVTEFPATRDFEDRPPLILNAHMDTIWPEIGYSPELMDFDVKTREFFHRKEKSFGADDKAGVTVLLSALRTAKSDYWDRGVGHRRVLLIFTAQEESGGLGARYLAEHYPQLFENVEIALTTDGPVNYDKPPFYPRDSFVIVVDKEKSYAPPYRKIIEYVQELCELKNVTSAKSSAGLGQGDFAFFPPQAHTDLHIRAPYQNNHRRERVKLDDLFNHIDLFTYIVLRLDGIPVHPIPKTKPASSPVFRHEQGVRRPSSAQKILG